MDSSAVPMPMPSYQNERSGIRGLFTVLGAVQVTVIAAITMLTVALPQVQRDLHTSSAGLALVSAIYSVSFGGLLLCGGRLSDVVGARPALLAGLAVFGLGSLTGAIAPTLAVLAAARAGQGVGAALIAPAAFSSLLAVVPDRAARPAVLARWGVLSSLGASVGVAMFGALSTWVSWRWLFVIPAVVAALAAACTPALVPRAPVPVRPARIGWPAAVLGAAGLMVLLLGAQISPWLLPPGAVLLLAFLLQQRRASSPLLRLHLLRRRGLALAAVGAASAAMATMFFVLSLHLQTDLGFTPLQTSAVFLLAIPGVCVSGAMARRLIPRFGSRQLLLAGLVMAAAGATSLGALTWPPLSPWGGLLVFAVGAGLAFAAATVAATSDVPACQAGAVGAVLNTVMEFGPALGLAVLPAAGNTLASRPDAGSARTLELVGTLLLAVVLIAALFRHAKPALPDRTSLAMTEREDHPQCLNASPTVSPSSPAPAPVSAEPPPKPSPAKGRP